MQICLIGQTGSGKTTIAKELSEANNIPHLSSGMVARRLAEQDATTRNALDRGMMAPEEAMRIQMQAVLEQAMVQDGGFVLEGFPRTVPQLIALMAWTSFLPSFIEIDCPQMECATRLVARGRPDDHPDSIARKFEIYKQVTMPMLDMLSEAGLLHVVQSESKEETLAAVRHLVEL